MNHVLADAGLPGMLLDGLQHRGIVAEAQDHVLTAQQLERLDRPFQPFVQSRHGPLQPSAEEPAHGRNEDVTQRRHRRENAFIGLQVTFRPLPDLVIDPGNTRREQVRDGRDDG